ncbi:MAG: hypothetical protein AAGI44_02025, partial [Pseudomonadota bacterium]
ADEVMSSITGDANLSERDKLLREHWEIFKWWADKGRGSAVWTLEDYETLGPNYSAKLFDKAVEEGRDPELVAWLNYTGARIGYRSASAAPTFDKVRAGIATFLPRYGDNFSEQEIETFKKLAGDMQVGDDLSVTFLPWAVRGKLVYCDSYSIWRRHGGEVNNFPEPEWWGEAGFNLETDC